MSRAGRIALATLLLVAAALRAEEAPQLRLEDFQIIQYVGSRGLSPDAIMRLDTNAEILVACREPRTPAELRAAGIDFVESQLVLLRAMRMLRLEEGLLETLLPLLAGEEAATLRAATAAAAPPIVTALGEELRALREALDERGAGAQAFSVFFSYVLDGMVWEFLEEYEEVRPRRLSAASPHWAGEIWGIHPPRGFAPTTRSIARGDLRLKLGLSPAAMPAVAPLLADWRRLQAWLDEIGGGRSPDAELRGWLASFGLVDEEGSVAVPVLREVPGDGVFEASQRLTEKLVDLVLEQLDLTRLANELSLRGRQQTLIVAYHELMWDLLEAFEAAGLVERPALLTDPARAAPADVAGVAFVVDRRREADRPSQDPETDTDED